MKNIMKAIKHFIIQSKIKFPDQLPPQLKFKIAQTKEEYISAMKILYDCYREKGYTAPNENGIRLTPYHLLPSTTVVLALWENEIIGTMSLIRDSPVGLPLDSIFDLSQLRAKHQVVCEVSSLAIKKEFRGKAGEIFHPLIRYCWNYTLRYFGVDYLVIAVNPSMYELYEAAYLFEPLALAENAGAYDFANKNPAVGEYVDARRPFEELPKQFRPNNFRNRLRNFMTQEVENTNSYPCREYFSHSDSPVNADWLLEFENFIPDLQSKPTIKDKMARALGHINYEDLRTAKTETRQRVPVSFLVNDLPNVKITDISQSGLKLIGKLPEFVSGVTRILNCQISDSEFATVVVEPVWRRNDDEIGFRVLESTEGWNKMLQNTLQFSRPTTKLTSAA